MFLRIMEENVFEVFHYHDVHMISSLFLQMFKWFQKKKQCVSVPVSFPIFRVVGQNVAHPPSKRVFHHKITKSPRAIPPHTPSEQAIGTGRERILIPRFMRIAAEDAQHQAKGHPLKVTNHFIKVNFISVILYSSVLNINNYLNGNTNYSKNSAFASFMSYCEDHNSRNLDRKIS